MKLPITHFRFAPNAMNPRSDRARVLNHHIDPKTRILRFMNLPRLFDLLSREHIFFTPIATLIKTDPYESARVIDFDLDDCKKPRLVVEAEALYKFAKPEAERTIPNKDPRPFYRDRLNEMSEADLRKFVLHLLLVQSVSRIACSCWHMNEGESDAMWRLYCQENGVAIQSTVERLQSSLKRPDGLVSRELHIAGICYLNDDEEPHEQYYAEYPWMIKRRAFLHEQELRVWGKFVDYVPIDLDQLVETIIVTPLAPPWAQEAIKSAIEAFFSSRGKTKPNVVSSKHLSPPNTVFQMLQMPQEKLRNYRATTLQPSLAKKIRKKFKR